MTRILRAKCGLVGPNSQWMAADMTLMDRQVVLMYDEMDIMHVTTFTVTQPRDIAEMQCHSTSVEKVYRRMDAVRRKSATQHALRRLMEVGKLCIYIYMLTRGHTNNLVYVAVRVIKTTCYIISN